MSHRGWASLIISVLFIGMIIIFAVTDDSQPRGNGESILSELENDWDEAVVDTVGSGDTKILLLRVDGVIADSDSVSSSFSSSSFINQLNQAIDDKEIEGVVIQIDSPGGTVVDSEQIHKKLLQLKKSGKVVGVSMAATAASGGYYIAAPADYIYANPSTLTGSIGVILTVPNFEKTAEWIGYSETVISSGKMKDIGNPLRKMSEEERAVFQSLVSESYNDFVDIIVEGRNLSRAEVLKLADGRIYSGKQAKKLKLVDYLGSLEDAIAQMGKTLKTSDYQVVQYRDQFSFESLLGGLFASGQTDSLQAVKEFLPKFQQQPQLLYLYR